MFKKISLSFIAIALALPTIASARQGNPTRCAERVREAGCYLSNNDFGRIEDNVIDCKQVNARGARLEVFQLAQAGKLVVVDTTNRGSQYCPTMKYTIDYSGIRTIKIIAGNTFMLSNSGRVFFMQASQEVYEILNSRGRSYSNVYEIKGDMGGQAIRLIGPGFDNLMTMADITEKAYRGQLSKLNFIYGTTNRSIFRDE